MRIAPSARYDFRVIREQVEAAFSEEELNTFCFDLEEFRPVYRQFVFGMLFGQRVRQAGNLARRLLKGCIHPIRWH